MKLYLFSPSPPEGLFTVSIVNEGWAYWMEVSCLTENLNGSEAAHWISGTGDELLCAVKGHGWSWEGNKELESGWPLSPSPSDQTTEFVFAGPALFVFTRLEVLVSGTGG